MIKKLSAIPIVILLFFFIVSLRPLAADEATPDTPFSLTASWPGDSVSMPKITYNPKHKEYLAVYHWKNPFIPGGNKTQIHGARISEKGKHIATFGISDRSECLQQFLNRAWRGQIYHRDR